MNSENKICKKKESRSGLGKKAAIVGICINLFLSGIKVALGIIFGAISVIGDGVNNFFDALSSIVTLVGFRISEKPADSDHPYGHARFEYISAMIVATLILFAGFELAKGSVEKLISPSPVKFSLLAVVILLISVAAKLWLAFFYSKSAKKISSPSLAAASKDSLYDVLTTSFVLIALALEGIFGWRFDGIGGLLVALFIFRGGAGIIRETVDTLLGMSGSPQMRRELESVVGENPKILGYHDLLIHDYGPGNCFASVHVEIDHREEAMSCHRIIDSIERKCLDNLGVHMVIHYDPVVTDDTETEKLKELLSGILKSYSDGLSLHDLRIEKSANVTELIFDVSIPDCLSGEKEKITAFVNRAIKNEDENYTAIITYDPV